MEVDGVIYVGFGQNGDAELNIGLDKNTNSNGTRLFYKLGNGAQWLQSGIEGSVMIRPVFKSGKTFVWNSTEDLSEIEANVYPVPTTGMLTIEPTLDFQQNYTADIVDVNGRTVLTEAGLFGRSQLSLRDLTEGVYILVLRNQNGEAILRRRILKKN